MSWSERAVRATRIPLADCTFAPCLAFAHWNYRCLHNNSFVKFLKIPFHGEKKVFQAFKQFLKCKIMWKGLTVKLCSQQWLVQSWFGQQPLTGLLVEMVLAEPWTLESGHGIAPLLDELMLMMMLVLILALMGSPFSLRRCSAFKCKAEMRPSKMIQSRFTSNPKQIENTQSDTLLCWTGGPLNIDRPCRNHLFNF